MTIKKDIRYYQLEELEILREFQRLCAAHDLIYFVTAGTLLGTVRHKGFVPWDDDIDVVMPRKDFDMLQSICADELDPQFFYQSNRTDPYYPFYFAKIRKNGTVVDEQWLERIPMHKGIYIDIFPLDVCPRNELKAKCFFWAIALLTFSGVGKIDAKFCFEYRKRGAKSLYKCLKKLPLSILFGARDFVRRIVELTEDGSRLCTVGGNHGYPRETYEKSWFAERQDMSFENITVAAPAGWENLLTSMYGDYKRPPDESERDGHFTG